MPVIRVDRVTYDRLSVAARLIGVDEGEIVKVLLDRLTAEGSGQTGTAPRGETARAGERPDDWIPIFKVYKGNRIEGLFNPSTMAVKVTSDPWRGKVFTSPTAAAVDVVDHFPSDRRTSNTNGRKFWRLVSTGNDLRSVVGER